MVPFLDLISHPDLGTSLAEVDHVDGFLGMGRAVELRPFHLEADEPNLVRFDKSGAVGPAPRRAQLLFFSLSKALHPKVGKAADPPFGEFDDGEIRASFHTRERRYGLMAPSWETSEMSTERLNDIDGVTLDRLYDRAERAMLQSKVREAARSGEIDLPLERSSRAASLNDVAASGLSWCLLATGLSDYV